MVRLPSRKLFGSFSRKFIFILFVIGALIYIWLPYKNYPFTSLVGNVVTAPKKNKSLPFPMHQYPLNHASIINDLKDAMHHSWKAYVDYAWGMDEVLVLTKMGTRWMDAGLTMVDSLDTLWMYKMMDEFVRARDWIEAHINFGYNNDDTNVFESTIRLLGGLLSAYHISGDIVFLKKAELIGGKLIAAFNSPSGLPYTNINFQTLKASLPSNRRTVSLSEVATLQLEFNELAILLRDRSIARPAAGVYKILNEVSKLSGLLPIEINMYRPAHSSVGTITLGARGDSYYEYLLKVWVQTGKVSEWLRNEYITAVGGVKERLIRQSVPNGLIFVGELHASEFSTKMDHLVCFLPATLAYGYLHGMPEEHLHLAESLMETCFHLYKDTQTGLSAELVYFNLANFDRPDFYIKRSDAFNLLRPETVESLFYLYRITKNPKYQEWGLAIFRAFNASCRITPAGFAPIQDVQSSVPHHRDKMESFWTAETLKYLLLLFDEQLAAKFDLTEWVFNTEAHPFPLSKADALSVIQDLYNFNL
ncbi:Endoplasmic reticulum mannosyl-oligosaccharide 1,2-alpha-mannosidase [Echinococcus granulosus]|nr:Endoplasmic reticulum mannosyl-oligosaccharide 1,2-alpha-mannosidase [Echinococcus granulosus]